MYLVEDVTVQVGKGRPYNINEDINFPDIDTKVPVYPMKKSKANLTVKDLIR